jgi:probable F420-dependent oxidoreductase
MPAGATSSKLRWGLTLPFAGVPLAEHEPLVRRAEAAGYDDLWTGETNGADGFTPLALAAAWTERMRLGTGVVNPYTRGPAVLAQHAAALADASGGRFVLGLGASSNVIVERWNEAPYGKPLSRMRAVVPVLRDVFAGGRGPGGFKLETAPAQPIPIAIAALRDRMLRLGGEIGDGTFTNFLPLSAAEHVVARVREGEAEAGREPTEVICRFFCIPGDGIDLARFMFAAYATVPVYEAFFRSLGWGEAIDPMVSAWRDGDRKAALGHVPEELVREIFIFGDGAAMRERLGEYAAGGITTLVLSPIAPPEQIPDLIEALAP